MEGVLDTEEFFRAAAIYKGRLEFVENDIDLNVDFLIPAENKLTATADWATLATATPLADLQAAVKRFKAANRGQAPAIMHMSGAAESNLLQNEQIKSQIYGSPTDRRILTSADIRNVFTALSLPDYMVTDEMVDVGNGEERLLPEDRIVLIGNSLGKLLLGPTVENNYQPGVYVVPEIKATNPPQQAVFVGETAFPALKNPTAIVWLDV
ncbi:major capsid protein [Planococcus faecalis]|uniref:major capsid protein n=1 Tax=Planococcus faecalis TaxID=1598147 RepID=UPI0021094035|nr:major capsid protein [Planococcus faecalis]